MADTFANTSATFTAVTGYTLGMAPGTAQYLTELDGWIQGAPMRRSDTARLWGHGNFSEAGKRDARLVTLGGHYVAPDRATAADFVDEINAVMGDGSAGVLTVNDADLGPRSATAYLFGKPEVTWTGGRDVGFTLTMTCPDPRKYGAVVTANTAPPIPGGGLVDPLFAPSGVLDFGTPGSLGAVTFRNVGRADTSVNFRVRGRARGFTITRTQTGAKLAYKDTVPSGSSLYLNGADGTVKLDGYADRATGLTVAEWERLGPGETATYLFECIDTSARLYLEAAPAWW
jgi:hypothetical protein